MRRRLFALLVVPLAVLIVIAAQLIARASDDRHAAESAAHVVKIATAVARVDGALVNETLTAASAPQSSNSVQPAKLLEWETDTALLRLEGLLDPTDKADAPLLDATDAIRKELVGRGDLAKGWISPLQLVDRYRSVRSTLVHTVIERAAEEDEGQHSNELLGLILLIEARSAHLDERVSLDLVIRYDAWVPGQQGAAAAAVSSQLGLIERASALTDFEPPQQDDTLLNTRNELITKDGLVPALRREEWRTVSDGWLEQLNAAIDTTEVNIEMAVGDVVARAISTQRATFFGVLAAVTIALLATTLFGMRIVRRVRRIADAAGQLSLEETPLSINDRGSDEIGEMADAFDRMTERIRHAAWVSDVESDVRVSMLREDPIRKTLAGCEQLLPAGQRFAMAGNTVSLVEQNGRRTPLAECDLATMPEDSRLAVSLAEIAQLRSTTLVQLRHQATYDPLTNLLNRSATLRRLSELCAQGRPAVLFLDLDHFKRLNDAHGHDSGDRALVAVGTAIEQVGQRFNAVTGRLGGDEFVLIVNDELDDESLLALGQEILDRVNSLVPVAAASLTVSVGIAPNRSGQSTNELIHEADAAMYQAKREGRGRVVLADASLRRELEEFDEIERGLVRALKADEFEVAYQGIWDVRGQSLVALEALARWTDPEGRRHSPSDFFSVAERVGCAQEIDRLILAKVARQVRLWTDSGHVVPPVHVNMSAQTLSSASMVSNTLNTLETAGCPNEAIIAEITESSLISGIQAVSDRLDQLRAAGIRVAVDDFGDGYSSLQYLSKLPIDILKIDRQFISHIDSNQNNVAIVQAVVTLAQTLDITVVAEGVERVAEQRQLIKLGCAQLQGFLFDRPCGSDDLTLFPSQKCATVSQSGLELEPVR